MINQATALHSIRHAPRPSYVLTAGGVNPDIVVRFSLDVQRDRVWERQKSMSTYSMYSIRVDKLDRKCFHTANHSHETWKLRAYDQKLGKKP